MRLLVLGGTEFLSHAVAADAVARGHDVTCAARGTSGRPPEGARLVVVDRDAEVDWSTLDGQWDAVVDVARDPAWVDAALTGLGERAAYWVLVSSVSVYADHATPHGGPGTLPLLPALHAGEEAGDLDAADAYGARKVACEELVQQRAGAHWVVRPGLIVGPGDPTGRFAYWPDRLAGGGDVLAPDSPDRDVQLIDVRDLAAWLVTGAEQRLSGVHDAVGWVTTMGEVLDDVAAAVGSGSTLFWAHPGFLRRHHVAAWSGPRSLPLWLPEEMSGLVQHDAAPAHDAGLRTRPLTETAADTLAWLRTEAGRGRVTGLTRAEEQELLDDWHTI